MASSVPEQFGRYRILKKLGQGGMGAVYLAQDTQLDRQVALKVPRIEADDDPSVLQRFYREARAAAKLDHPNLCQVFDVGEHVGIPYMTMAYIEGRTLAKRLKSGVPLTPIEAVTVVRKLALALKEAHTRGIIHRDLKPANVMINQRGEPVVMDFGLARLSSKEAARITGSGAVIGTPSYMPPEQVRGEIDAMGPACDIYSLGVILYESLTAQVPFDGPVGVVLGQILTQQPKPPSALLDTYLDPRLDAICMRAMAKEATARYPSMVEMADVLGEFLRSPIPVVKTVPVVKLRSGSPQPAREAPILLPMPQQQAKPVTKQPRSDRPTPRKGNPRVTAKPRRTSVAGTLARSCLTMVGLLVVVAGLGLVGIFGYAVWLGRVPDWIPLGQADGKKLPVKDAFDAKAKDGFNAKPKPQDLSVDELLTTDDPRDPNEQTCYCKFYRFKMTAGRTYQIDMRSNDFDSYLRLEDPDGKVVASDDNGGGNKDAQIVHQAAATGDYRIIASTIKGNATGRFTLSASETAPPKAMPASGS